MDIWIDGTWLEIDKFYIGREGVLREATIFNEVTVPESTLTFTVNGNFEPWVELTSGSSAVISWYENGELIGTGPTPTLNGSGSRTIQCSSTNMNDIVMINLGFDSSEDAGRYNIGPSYNWENQQVTAVSGLQNAPNLVRFCASHAPFTGGIDFSGLSKLEYIECFLSNVRSVNLTGCTSLIRLCLESTMVSNLDLNPVRNSLYDLRAANQRVSALHFETLAGPMNNLYHYCVRDQVVTNSIPFSQLPVIEEMWNWNTHQSYADTPISPVARSMAMYENTFDQSSVDRILDGLVNNSNEGAYSGLYLLGSSAPSAAGIENARILRNRGWNVEITGGIPDPENSEESGSGSAWYPGYPTGASTVTTDDASDYSLGQRFNITANGTITHVCYYQVGNLITRPVFLWDFFSNELLWSGTHEDTAGWNAVPITPIHVNAGRQIMPAYRKPSGANMWYVASRNYPWPVSKTGIEAVASGMFSTNYQLIPNSSHQDSSYFADIIFVPDP